MWQTWQRAKTFNRLPSELIRVEDSIAAWMLDTAVMWFGLTIENALQERVKVGMGANVEYRPKYTLARLLDERFRLPRPPLEPEDSPNPWASLLSWVGKKRSGVKRWMYKKPEE